MKKKCPRCFNVFSIYLFCKDSTKKDGYDSICKSCRKEYRLKNKDKEKERHKQYREKNKDKEKERHKKYYVKNKIKILNKNESWRKCNLDKMCIYSKRYARNNPEKINEFSRKRRAKKKNVNENYKREDRVYTIKLFDNKCYKCSSSDNLCIDHHYPLSKGHPLTRKNAVVLCKKCNTSKHNKLPEEFYTAEQLKTINKILGLKNAI